MATLVKIIPIKNATDVDRRKIKTTINYTKATKGKELGIVGRVISVLVGLQ